MALSANQAVNFLPDFSYREIPAKSGAIHFYKGALVNYDASGFYAKLGSDTSGEVFAGVAVEELNQATGGSNGDNNIKVIPAGSMKVVELTLTSVARTNIGSDCYTNGDDVVALAATTTNDVRVGRIVDVSATANKCWVLLD